MNRKTAFFSILLIMILIASSNAVAQDKLPTRATRVAPDAVATTLGTTITYQGYLQDGGAPVNDDCDIQLMLYDDPDTGIQVGESQYHGSVPISDGYFTIPDLDFGWGVFNGQALFMEIAVRCPTSVGEMTVLSPRQVISHAPYALALPGMYTTLPPGGDSPNVIGGNSLNSVVSGAEGSTISGGGFSWSPNYVYDHVGTVSGGANNVAGSDDGDFWNADGATVGGGWNNTANYPISTVSGGANNLAGEYAATVGGGEFNYTYAYGATVSGGITNTVTGGAATVGGGYDNTAAFWADTVSGGEGNIADGEKATVGGGFNNQAGGYASTIGGGEGNYTGDWTATISGGYTNTATSPAATVGGGSDNHAVNYDATVAGGTGNTASGQSSSVLGGQYNTAEGYGSTVAGGGSNYAGGDFSLAAGEEAYADHNGSFVWSDTTGGFSSTADNQFIINATGGVGIGTNEPNGAALAATSTGMAMYLDGVATGSSYLTYAGFNTYWDPTWNEWIARTDTVHNAGGLITSSWVNGDLSFHTFDTFDGGYDQVVSLNNRMTIDGATGDVEIANDLEVNAQIGIGSSNPGYPLEIHNNEPWIQFVDTDSGQFDNWLIGMNGSNQRFEIWEEYPSSGDWNLRFWIDQDGLAGVAKLQITGGDLAEPFVMNGEVEPGMVVVIDPENPGQLQLSSKANDTLVAGCVSGANGLDAGILMYSEIGDQENTFPVALSGRVFCYADAAYGPIQPGDFLTTSDTPGHLMVVKDREAAAGAIVGKAMSALENGQDMILILVTLQ